MLGGEVVVIEGRGYDGNRLVFNAFAVVSPTGKDGKWEMRSYTQGKAGTFPFSRRRSGFEWSIPAGPKARVRYSATISGDTWEEIGEYVEDGQLARRVFQMNLRRTADTNWPAAEPVEPNASVTGR